MQRAMATKQKQGHCKKSAETRLSATDQSVGGVQLLPQLSAVPANSAAPPMARCRLTDGVLGEPHGRRSL
jgi:hypothetical protein